MFAVRAEASAPGKLILMGEHAAVYGSPAVVASVGLRTVARAAPAVRAGLELALIDLGHHANCAWEEVVEVGNRRRELWQAYRNDPSPERFSALASADEAGVVKVAAAEALRFLERSPGSPNRPGLKLSVSSKLPVGSGFGSSASVAATVVAALLASLAGEPAVSRRTVANLALEVEKRQHGQPSGVDHTTVLRGGFLLLERREQGLAVTELARPDWLRSGLRVFDTGAPAETTGEVVAAVRQLRATNSSGFRRTLGRMEGSTRAFADALASEAPAWPAVLTAVKTFERCLESLQVVPVSVKEAVRRVEAAGGAAKISGAGASTGERAGSLITFWPSERPGEPKELLEAYRPLDAELGVEGLEWSRDDGA